MNANKLISVIIPCYNAEHWLSEAIDSCLTQSYQPVEIIVIDDGSTDGSLEVIKSYGDRITWETGPNQGGNHARNRGFARSKGNYIQFLDADDYLLPQKLEKQAHFLEITGADVVYGDWRHQYHLENDDINLDDVKVSGNQPDILKSLLSGWWVSPACILFRRSAIESSGGWDETFTAGQDKDFFLSIVMSGAVVKYQPGCHSIYRRYGDVTVSTSSKEKFLENHVRILEKYEHQLNGRGELSACYKDAIAQSLFSIARSYLNLDKSAYEKHLEKVILLSPNFYPQASERARMYDLLQRQFGFYTVEKIAVFIKTLKGKLIAW